MFEYALLLKLLQLKRDGWRGFSVKFFRRTRIGDENLGERHRVRHRKVVKPTSSSSGSVSPPSPSPPPPQSQRESLSSPSASLLNALVRDIDRASAILFPRERPYVASYIFRYLCFFLKKNSSWLFHVLHRLLPALLVDVLVRKSLPGLKAKGS